MLKIVTPLSLQFHAWKIRYLQGSEMVRVNYSLSYILVANFAIVHDQRLDKTSRSMATRG